MRYSRLKSGSWEKGERERKTERDRNSFLRMSISENKDMRWENGFVPLLFQPDL